jgi:hypothetical protein
MLVLLGELFYVLLSLDVGLVLGDRLCHVLVPLFEEPVLLGQDGQKFVDLR